MVYRPSGYLRGGNNIQASEKGWDAVAQAAKVIAEERGWNHGGHRRIVDVVQQVADEHNRQGLIRLFGIAQALHTNFYEDWLDSDTVSIYLDDVKELRLQEQIRSEGHPCYARTAQPPAAADSDGDSQSGTDRWILCYALQNNSSSLLPTKSKS